MATTNVNFKIKNGLVVEGSTATVNGNSILVENTQATDSYIIDLIGGETLITSVDSADFTVTAGELTIASGSDLARSGDITNAIDALTTNDIGEDPLQALNLYFTDARAKSSAMDILVNSNQSNISITYNNASDGLVITAENGVAGSTTDDLTQGINNLYFSTSLVDNHLSGGDGISYSSGTISADVENGLVISPLSGKIIVDRTTTDTWYDTNGAAADVATDLSTHETATTGIHGVTGDIVGTSDTQTLSNKMINGNLNFENLFVPGSSAASITYNGMFNALQLTSTTDVRIDATNNVIINATDGAYIGSASAENEIATHSYVDNAVSGLSWKQAVNLLSTTNVDISGVGSAWPIDSHAKPTENYRILLTGQADAVENGIWVFDAVVETFSRPADADAYDELIGAAVYVMEGTQYGSTSWVQSNHYLTDFTGQSWTQFSGQGSITAGNGIVVDGLEVSIDTAVVATQTDLTDGLALKQDTLTEGSNILIQAGTISVTGLDTDDVAEAPAGPLYFTDSRATDAVKNGLIGQAAAGYQAVSIDFVTGNLVVPDLSNFTTDNLSEGINNLYYTDSRVSDAINNSLNIGGAVFDAIENAVPDNTDGLSEGANNLYYTDGRAESAAINLLTNATKNNIEISYVPNVGLTITAENGVADSTTDDLDEGSTNLYFNNGRAIDAINGNLIQPEKVDIGIYRREEATQQYVASASTVTAHTFTGNKSVKYLIRTVGNVTGTLHSQITELLVTVDGNNNAAITEYGTIYTSENPLATATMDYSGGEHRLRVTTAISGAEVVVAATILNWAD